MHLNPLQFAVVREDPRVEIDLVERHGCRRALLVGSGGCTALTLQARFPDLALTVADPNPAQLDHIRTKTERLQALAGDRAARLAAFNVETSDPRGLSECGNFESLFRGWRALLHDLVLPAGVMRAGFADAAACRNLRTALISHRYWPVAFELFFSDALLLAMFGEAALQHAPAGSYPGYFRAAIERGLARPEAFNNPFLHHLLLGHYLDRPGALPEFLTAPPPAGSLKLIAAPIAAGTEHEATLPHFAAYDLIGLSNICDWMAPEATNALLARLRREVRPGTVVLWRQLNNVRDLAAGLGPAFRFDAAWDAQQRTGDRSCFYNRIGAGARR